MPAFGALTHRKILIDGYEAALKARDTAAEKRSGHPKWDNVLRTVGGGGGQRDPLQKYSALRLSSDNVVSRVLYRCLRANSPLGVAVLALVLAAYFVALHFVRGGGVEWCG